MYGQVDHTEAIRQKSPVYAVLTPRTQRIPARTHSLGGNRRCEGTFDVVRPPRDPIGTMRKAETGAYGRATNSAALCPPRPVPKLSPQCTTCLPLARAPRPPAPAARTVRLGLPASCPTAVTYHEGTHRYHHRDKPASALSLLAPAYVRVWTGG
jgi:hypothetical protein